MSRGGARNRSGPRPDPNSLRSARRGLSLTALPAEGYDGDAPKFPLPPLLVHDVWFESRVRRRELDQDATDARYERELELWAALWRTPQAVAWAREPWRSQAVAMYVRTMALCESGSATAADRNSLHRFADQIGMTPAGLVENGWKIAAPVAPAGPGAARRSVTA